MKRTSISFLAACSMMAAPWVLAQTDSPSPEQEQDMAVFTSPVSEAESLMIITQGRYCGPVRVSPRNPLLEGEPLVGLWVFELPPYFSKKVAVPLPYLEELIEKLPAKDGKIKRALGRVVQELTKDTQNLKTGKLLRGYLVNEENAQRTGCVPIGFLPFRAAGRAPA